MKFADRFPTASFFADAEEDPMVLDIAGDLALFIHIHRNHCKGCSRPTRFWIMAAFVRGRVLHLQRRMLPAAISRLHVRLSEGEARISRRFAAVAATMTSRMIHKYIDLAEIVGGDLSGLEPHERPEALRLLAQGVTNLAAATVPEPTPKEKATENWLEPEEVEASYPAIKRRWLFENAGRMTWIKRISRKRLLIDEAGLKSWLLRRA